MFEQKTWEEFRTTGLLWWINTTLHVFGWAIVMEYDAGDKIISTYPARTDCRGFDTYINDKGYENVTEYLKNNSERLYNDVFGE